VLDGIPHPTNSRAMHREAHTIEFSLARIVAGVVLAEPLLRVNLFVYLVMGAAQIVLVLIAT
jgi:uncharacterized membrane protein